MATIEKQTQSWPGASTQINVLLPAELEFWSKRFRVSTGKLKQAVRAVGPKYQDVSRYLRLGRKG
jgi:hypothetical protein